MVQKYTIVFIVISSRFLHNSDRLASGLKNSRYRNPNHNFHRRWKEIQSYPPKLGHQFSYHRSSEVLWPSCLNNGFVVSFYLRKVGLHWLISFTNFNAQFFIHYQYVCYITLLDMFRASTCLSWGGQNILSQHLVSSLSVQLFTESDDTRCCDNTSCPPEDGHVDARNMSRIVCNIHIVNE